MGYWNWAWSELHGQAFFLRSRTTTGCPLTISRQDADLVLILTARNCHYHAFASSAAATSPKTNQAVFVKNQPLRIFLGTPTPEEAKYVHLFRDEPITG